MFIFPSIATSYLVTDSLSLVTNISNRNGICSTSIYSDSIQRYGHTLSLLVKQCLFNVLCSFLMKLIQIGTNICIPMSKCIFPDKKFREKWLEKDVKISISRQTDRKIMIFKNDFPKQKYAQSGQVLLELHYRGGSFLL